MNLPKTTVPPRVSLGRDVWSLGRHTVYAGDNLALLRAMPSSSVDAVVTDPPYGLGTPPDAVAMLRDWLTTGSHDVTGSGFMGRAWDATVPQPALWREVWRVLRPGGHLLAFFGTRTHDIGTLAIRLGGFEIRDTIMWVYGSGFPKSQNISIAIDKQAGAMGHRAQRLCMAGQPPGASLPAARDDTAHEPITDAARTWHGWGTALKPACEPVVVARKPIAERTIAQNVLTHGTGAINVDACRVTTSEDTRRDALCGTGFNGTDTFKIRPRRAADKPPTSGRWPANLIHDGSPEAVAGFPDTGPGCPQRIGRKGGCGGALGHFGGSTPGHIGVWPSDDGGSAARFFYAAKASKAERAGSRHPTVKPLSLMRYLVRLVTPPGGIVLDPYLGSGTTMLACDAEGFRCVGAEAEHVGDILTRWHAHEGTPRPDVDDDDETPRPPPPPQIALFGGS